MFCRSIFLSITYGNMEYSYHILVLVNDIIAIIAFIPIGTACALTLSYLNSISLAKKCLLLYLYQDVVSSCLWIRSLRMIEAVLSYYNVNGTSKTEAFAVSFGLWFGFLYLSLILIFVSISKLYMAKSNTIDTPIPFLSKNELLAIRQIRIACFLLVVGFLFTTFGVGWYPLTYHDMKQDREDGTNWIYRCSISVLLSISGVLTVAKRYYENTTDLQIDQISDKSQTQTKSTLLQIDQIIPSTIRYFFVLSLSTSTCFIVADAAQLVETKKLEKIMQIIISLILIISLLVLIYRSNQLKKHSIRIIKNKYDDFFMLSIYLVPTFTFMLINFSLYMFL